MLSGKTLAIGSILCLIGCNPAPSAPRESSSSGAELSEIVGPTDRDAIDATYPAWRDAAAAAQPDEAISQALAEVPPGAEVDVFLGTWCGDSRREIGRLFRALEAVTHPPFTIRFIAVDRAKQAPGYTENVDLRFVPTIVVRRNGAEVGRIIESAPRGIERELLDLLTGVRTGVISGRTDL